MNLWGPEFFDDAGLIAEIKQYASARREVRGGNPATIVRKIQGEGRLLEFAPVADSMKNLDADLREMMAEARRRGLPIGGTGSSAIAVEIGYP
jgi:hypothetical protein